MKNAKRILVALALVATLAVSAIVGLAADATAADYTDILKYYDPLYSKILIDEDFEGEGFVGDTVCNANDTISNRIQVAGDENKYLSITAGGIANSAAIGDMLYYYNLDEASGLFLFDFSIYADHSEGTLVKCHGDCGTSEVYYGEAPADTACPVCGGEISVKDSTAPVVAIYLDDDAHTDSSTAGVPFATFDFERGVVEYYAASTYLTFKMKLVEEKWYNVQFALNKSAYSLTVTDASDSSKSETTDFVGTPSVFDAKSVKVGYTAAYDNRDTEVRIDDVYLQLGDSYRNVSDDELFTITKNALFEMNKMLESKLVSTAVKIDVVRVYDELCQKYGLRELISADSEAVGYADSIVGNLLVVYAGMLKEGVDQINVNASYSDRLALVESYQVYADKVAENLGEAAPADIVAVYDAFCAEVADLKSDEENTLLHLGLYDSIVASGRDFFSTDYTTTKSIYDEVNASFLKDGAYTFNATYPGAQTAINAFIVCRDRYEGSVRQSTTFIDAVNAIATATTDADKLAAYATAVANRFENTTYPGVGDAITTLDSYLDLKAIGDYAEKFLSVISQAGAALNLASKGELLDTAATMLDDVNENYPGVVEAKATYLTLRQDIENSKAAAAAYVAAVKALAGLDGDELRDAVAKALVLKESGNIVEIDGVVEANIALDTAKSALDLMDSYADKFIRLVDAIDSDASLSERHAAISAAKKAEAKADDSIDGVSEAKLELASLVIKYNSDINSVNAANAAITSCAADFSGSAVTADGLLLKVVALIKSILG